MADAPKTKKKGTRKAGPRFSVRLVDDNGVGLKIATAFDYRNKLYRVQPTVWPNGFGKGKEFPRQSVQATTVGPEFAEAEAKVKEIVAEQEAAGWQRAATKGAAAYSAIPAPGTVGQGE